MVNKHETRRIRTQEHSRNTCASRHVQDLWLQGIPVLPVCRFVEMVWPAEAGRFQCRHLPLLSRGAEGHNQKTPMVVVQVKRKILVPIQPHLPDTPPMGMVALAVETHDDYECHKHGWDARASVVKMTYALTDSNASPFIPETINMCIDCFNQSLRSAAKSASQNHAIWEDGWEIPCQICGQDDRNLNLQQRTLFVEDINDTESAGWDSHPTYLICDECIKVCELGVRNLHELYDMHRVRREQE